MLRIKNYKFNYYDIDVIETVGETKKYNLIFYKNIIGKDGRTKKLKTFYTLMKDYTLKECLVLAGEDSKNIFANVKINYGDVLTIDEKISKFN